MRSKSDKPKKIQGWEHLLIPAVVAAIVAAIASSCSPKIINHYIYQRDTTYIEKVRVDSLWQKDSVFIREKGDTLYIYKEHIRDRYRYIHDTAYVTKVDSVVVEREKIVEVEKPLSKWKSTQIRAFWWLLGGLVLSLVLLFRKPLWKLLKIVIK